MSHYEMFQRTRPHRKADRVSYDRPLVHSILDEALVSHLGFDADGPLVLPVIHARIGESLYLHFSSGAGAALRAPMDVCLTATVLDGLVLAKSHFHHSLNYRCVVVRGSAVVVTDPREREQALTAVVDRVEPGRSTRSRPPTAKELAATKVLRLDLREVSAKVRSGPPIDEPDDSALPHWSGVIPVHQVLGPPQATAEPGNG